MTLIAACGPRTAGAVGNVSVQATGGEMDREKLVQENAELAEQVREGVAEAEAGETAYLGEFSQFVARNPQDTKEYITELLSQTVQENSLLSPKVAREFAEKAVAKLLEGEYLIADEVVRTVTGTVYAGRDGAGVDEVWAVYTTEDPEEEKVEQ